MKQRKNARKPVKKPARKPVKKPARKPVKKPARKPVKKPARKLVKKPARKPVKKPARKPVKKPARKPVKKPARKRLPPGIPKGATLIGRQRGRPRTKAKVDRLAESRRAYLEFLHGRRVSLATVKKDPEFKRLVAKLTRLTKRAEAARRRGDMKTYRKLTAANGDLADALVDLGLRDPDARYRVGNS